MTGTGVAPATIGIAGILLGVIAGYYSRKLLDARQIRYTRLYERRAQVLEGLYESLFEVGDLLRVWGSVGGFREDQQREFERRYDAFYRYYRAKSLWLDNQTRRMLDDFFKVGREVRHMIADLREFASREEWDELQSGTETPRTRAEARAWVEEKSAKDIPKLMDQLRDDFREIIEISDLRDRDVPRSQWRRYFGF